MIFNMVGGSGGSGATLVVSSPANVSVTVSKDDKSYTKNSGSLGSTTFKGLATGTWTVTISGNGQTATKTIEITADYSTTIAFFSATINITYPAKSTCVVKNSGGTTVASDTNTGSSTKTWTATVNATGTYTVTATATDGSGKSKSQSVEITSEGQSVSVTLSYQLVAFDNGVIAPEFGEISLAVSGTGGLTDEGLLRLGGDAYSNDKATFTGAINPSNNGYKTLKMLITSSESGGTFGLSSDSNTSTTNWIASNQYERGLADAVVSCPIDAVNADCYIKVISSNNSSGRKYANISKIWLE